MREVLFSQDGWGCQHVNQDTTWEIPGTPEPPNKDSTNQTLWKPVINNGTDLWETNLRNGGQPPTQSIQKPSWGHTPSSNLGGTWGEDDDGTDGTSVWTGPGSNPIAVSNVGVNVNTAVGGPTVGPPTVAQWGPGGGVSIGNAGNINVSATNALPVTASGGTSGTASGSITGNAPGTSSNVGASGNGWGGDLREMRNTGALVGGNIDMRNIDSRTSTSNESRDLRLIDPRDPIRGDPRGISGRLNGTSEMWNHHQQITHNPIPSINKVVGQSVGGGGGVNISAGVGVPGLGTGSLSNAMTGAVGTQWGIQPPIVAPKDITKQVSGWDEPSPPSQRRNLPNYDDGTSLWSQQNRVPQSGGHWKDMSEPIARAHIMRPQNPNNSLVAPNIIGNCNMQVGTNQNQLSAVVPQSRIVSGIAPGVAGSQHKQDNSGLWIHAAGNSRNPNTPWPDDSHGVGGSVVPIVNWADEKPNVPLSQIGGTSWNDASSGGGWNNKQNKMSAPQASGGWPSVADACSNDANDSRSDWSPHVTGGIVGKTQPPKVSVMNVGVGVGGIGMNLEMVKQSKQYRFLVENGYKKEDVERALLNANMNLEEAAEFLRTNSSLPIDSWRRHDETLGSYTDHGSSSTSANFSGRYASAGAQSSLSFAPTNLLNSGNGSSNNSNMTVQVQKYLNQTHNAVAGGPQVGSTSAAIAFGQTLANANSAVSMSSNSTNQPSAHQLKMLVHQIHLAVQGRYLSSEILNQPLSPTTLLLLNQLLNYIKHLQNAQQSISRGGNQTSRATIARYEQEIRNLQNQINAQQAMYIKQQQPQSMQKPPQHHSGSHMNISNSEYLRNHDNIGSLHSNFSDMSLSKQPSGYPGVTSQQSRLNQWKLPSMEKEGATDSIDFSRAPGAIKHNLSVTSPSSIGSLGLQTEGAWSSGRNASDGWPDSSTENENKDWSVGQNSAPATYTDLVQEFEPGKPWKGSQIKSIEDDPSVTPGSVARSPLSINAPTKDSDIFSSTGKNSPSEIAAIGISTTTWSFNPSQSFQGWADNSQQNTTSELWSTSITKAPRGPPPGLSSNKGSASNSSASTVSMPNGWPMGRGTSSTLPQWPLGNSSWGSNWLLLKNLTAQIEGSTLRTLCVQHGPLQNFHLYLSQGIALCKYATREEANKAQIKLNNCQIQNATICAESPSEAEVQSILQSFPQSTSSANSICGNSGATNSAMCNSAASSISGSGNPNTGGNSVAEGGRNNTVKNSSNCSNNPTSNAGNVGSGSVSQPTASSGISTTAPTNPTWRQPPAQNQAQQQQSQSRPITGRENDFDYISQYVCSIVDD